MNSSEIEIGWQHKVRSFGWPDGPKYEPRTVIFTDVVSAHQFYKSLEDHENVLNPTMYSTNQSLIDAFWILDGS